MPHTPSSPDESLRQRVAARFDSRPSLRQVLAKAGLAALAARYPWVAEHADLHSLESLSILHAPDSAGTRRQTALMDTLLEHLRTGRAMALAASDRISLAPPEVFSPLTTAGEQRIHPAVDLQMTALNSLFDAVLAAWVEEYQYAQIGYWCGSASELHVPRLRWVAQLLKSALLNHIERQGLDDEEKDLLYALIEGNDNSLSINALQVTLDDQGSLHPLVLPDLLLCAERGTRQLTLWCKPCGNVRGFTGQAAFATALADELAERYRFDTLSWASKPLLQNAFDFQADQLLNGILDSLGRLQLSQIDHIDQLEALLRQLTDPGNSFPQHASLVVETTSVPLPDWLTRASASDRFQYQQALLELAASQALAQGETSLDDIEDLARYAARRLGEQMLLDHPDKTPYDPDHLTLEIAQVVEISSTGPALLAPLRTQTLTELAIQRLHSDAQEVLTRIDDGHQGPPDAWLNLDYVESLISTVDIGGQYPLYVDRQLQRVQDRPARIRRFAREWRASLLLAALQAKIDNSLSERAWQAIADFCRSRSGQGLRLAPLAFLSTAQASSTNTVHYMFLIQLTEPAGWVLYRPMLTDAALMEFASLDQLAAKVRAGGELQQSILAWMDDDARAIYADGGFTSPHLHPQLSELAHLLGGSPALLDSLLQSALKPASVAFTAWTGDLDSHVYQARAQAMQVLASRQSPSNAQLRWAMIVRFAWVAFNTLSSLLPGPAATLAWLLSSLAALKDDLSTLANGSKAEKVLAATDLLVNLAMLLVHAPATTGKAADTAQVRLTGPRPGSQHIAARPGKPEATPWATPSQASRASVGVARWHDNQNLGNLSATERQALTALQASIDLDGHPVVTFGRLRGLYQIDARHYVNLQGSAFEVEEHWSGVRIVGPEQTRTEWSTEWGGEWDGYHIVGRERRKGPWLTRWNGEWRIDLNLAGGMPKSRAAISEANQQAFQTLLARRKDNDSALIKLDRLIEANAKRIEPYEEATRAYNRALGQLPETARTNPPADLQASLQALRSMRAQVRPQLSVLTLSYEKQALLLQANIDLFAEMSKPQYARLDPTGGARFARGQWAEQLLTNDMYLFHRLLELPDYETLKQQAKHLDTLPMGAEQATLYVAFRDNVASALDIHRRILRASVRLDENLLAIGDDLQVQFENKEAKIRKMINQRLYSTLIVRAQIFSDLAELVLDRERLTDESFDELRRLQADLRDRDFQQALLSHDGLAVTNLSHEERAEILGNALREYEISIGKARYLASIDDPAVNSGRLEEYVEALSTLKDLAERELSATLADADQDAAPVARKVAHRLPKGRRKLIRTSRGRTILVEQAAQEDRAVQHDPMTEQAVTHYKKHGEQWIEQPGTAANTVNSNAYLRSVGTRLLARADARIALAARYTDQPNSLADLMEWQIQDMADIASQLEADARAGQPLASELRTAITALRTQKRRLLIDAYLNTRHPDSSALRYLLQEGQVEISLAKARKRLGEKDYLDVYTIDRKLPRQKLWEAHFHYSRAEDPPRAFAKGHLKFWEPRAVGRDEQLDRSTTAAGRISIYRGDLRLDQIEDLIPFPAV